MSHRSCTTSSAPISHLILHLLLATFVTAASIPQHANPSNTSNTSDTGPIIFKIPGTQLTLEYHVTHPDLQPYLNPIQIRTCALRNQIWIETNHPADPRYPHASQRLAPFNSPERFCHLPEIYVGVGYERQSDLLSWVDLMNVFRGLHMAAWEPWFYNFAGVASVKRETSSGAYEVSEVGMYFDKPAGWLGGNGTAPAAAVAAANRDASGAGGSALNSSAAGLSQGGSASSVATA